MTCVFMMVSQYVCYFSEYLVLKLCIAVKYKQSWWPKYGHHHLQYNAWLPLQGVQLVLVGWVFVNGIVCNSKFLWAVLLQPELIDTSHLLPWWELSVLWDCYAVNLLNDLCLQDGSPVYSQCQYLQFCEHLQLCQYLYPKVVPVLHGR